MTRRTVLYVQISSGMGGSSHSLLLLVRYIAKYGYRPIIAGQQDREGLWEEAERLGIPYYPLYLTSWAKGDLGWKDVRYFPHRVNTWRRLVQICRKEQVRLIHSNLVYSLDGAIAARLTGIAHLMHVRDQFADPRMAQWWGGPDVAARVIASLSERIICVSHAVMQPFARNGFARKAVRISNPIERPPAHLLSDGVRTRARARFGIPPDVPLVVLVGQIIERKGQGDFISAAHSIHARHPDVHFLIAGGGEPAYVERLTRQAGALFHRGIVRIVRHQHPVWPVYAAADVVACPSWVEGFGRVPVEAMLAGRPVVATSVGGIVDIVQHEKTGLLVPPAQPDALAEAIMRLLEDEALRKRLAEAGKRHAEREYDPDVHARRVAALYDEVLNT